MRGKRVTIDRLLVTSGPPDMAVEFRCSGRGCPVKRRTITPSRGRANVLKVDHHREGMDLPVTGTEIELTLAMRDEDHCSELLARIAGEGYPFERLR